MNKRILPFPIWSILFLVEFILNLFGSAYAQNKNYLLNEVHYSSYRWTGVAVSNTRRIFVNFPRWSDIPYSVAEIVDTQLIAYPNTEWNTWTDSTPAYNHFACVQSVYIDKENYLWILDAASYKGQVLDGGAKLMKIDLQADSIIQVIYFDKEITLPKSYLNDVRIDTKDKTAYLTDSGLGAIIVVDLSTGKSRRVLDNHYSVKAENIKLSIDGKETDFPAHSDGLALSNDGKYLYYKALTANNLYRIKTEKLKNSVFTNTELENSVEFVFKTFPSDAIEFDQEGNLYLTAVQENAIYSFNNKNELKLIVKDDKLKWPDSFSITPSGGFYVTSSRILFPYGLHYLFKLVEF